MTTLCPNGFDQTLLSGHLDRELTQADDQRTRLHVEDCPDCRRQLADIANVREATMNTQFAPPKDDSWNEDPKGALSTTSRGLGWLFLILWLVGVAGIALWGLLTTPGDLLVKILVLSGLLGGALLFLSVLIDRLRTMKTDRYRRVQK